MLPDYTQVKLRLLFLLCFRKLGKEVTVRELREEKLAEESDRISLLMEQVEDYKKMNEESKRQFAESEKQRKQEINEYEKKAHSNWVWLLYYYFNRSVVKLIKRLLLKWYTRIRFPVRSNIPLQKLVFTAPMLAVWTV